MLMEGIQFVTNSKGKKVAVQIDLKRYGHVWEDIYDNLLAQSRSKEPRVSWKTVKNTLKKQGKL